MEHQYYYRDHKLVALLLTDPQVRMVREIARDQTTTAAATSCKTEEAFVHPKIRRVTLMALQNSGIVEIKPDESYRFGVFKLTEFGWLIVKEVGMTGSRPSLWSNEWRDSSVEREHKNVVLTADQKKCLEEAEARNRELCAVAIDYDQKFFESIATGNVDWRDTDILEQLFCSSGSHIRRFYSNRYSDQLIGLIESKEVVVDAVKLMPEVPDGMSVPIEFCQGGGASHSRLKFAAALWVANYYKAPYLIEETWEAGRADILVSERKIAIECGDTEARKTIETLAHGWTAIHIPFSACAPHAVRMIPQFPDMDKRMGFGKYKPWDQVSGHGFFSKKR